MASSWHAVVLDAWGRGEDGREVGEGEGRGRGEGNGGGRGGEGYGVGGGEVEGVINTTSCNPLCVPCIDLLQPQNAVSSKEKNLLAIEGVQKNSDTHHQTQHPATRKGAKFLDSHTPHWANLC